MSKSDEPSRKHLSPCFDPVNIPVEFAVIHYTAQSFQGSLRIFCGLPREPSAGPRMRDMHGDSGESGRRPNSLARAGGAGRQTEGGQQPEPAGQGKSGPANRGKQSGGSLFGGRKLQPPGKQETAGAEKGHGRIWPASPPTGGKQKPGSRQVSCHLLINGDGEVFEMVPCWRGECLKAFHAGKSQWTDSSGRLWQRFNDFSIGIELVNWNGNFCPYTESQYRALCQALRRLKEIYPALRDPERILGHEHIAGFRGKSDPGRLFDWGRVFQEVFQAPEPRGRRPRLTEKQAAALSFLAQSPRRESKSAPETSGGRAFAENDMEDRPGGRQMRWPQPDQKEREPGAGLIPPAIKYGKTYIEDKPGGKSHSGKQAAEAAGRHSAAAGSGWRGWPDDEKAAKISLILESPLPFWLKKIRLRILFRASRFFFSKKTKA